MSATLPSSPIASFTAISEIRKCSSDGDKPDSYEYSPDDDEPDSLYEYEDSSDEDELASLYERLDHLHKNWP